MHMWFWIAFALSGISLGSTLVNEESRVCLELNVEDLFSQEEIQDGLESSTPVIIEGMAYEAIPFPTYENEEWRSGWDSNYHHNSSSIAALDGQFMRDQSAQVKVGQSVVVRLPVTHGPKREYLWKLNMTYDDDTFLLNRDEKSSGGSASIQFILENSGYVAPRSPDESAYQQLVFKGIQPGILTLPFVYNRPWYNDLQPGGAATFVTVQVLPRRSSRAAGGGGGGSVHPVTKTSFTVFRGQHLEIKLGNSPTQQYNLWKMMEIFDTNSGHVLRGPDNPALLEFVFRESGYVPPVLQNNATSSSISKSPIVRSAGYQKFTMFARAPGRQVLHFAFVKPWLPDDQPDKTMAIIDITILDRAAGRGLNHS